jgi:hypothetical protein
MSDHRAQTHAITKPLVVVPVFIAIAIAGAALPQLLGWAPYGQQAIDERIDHEDSTLCEKFGFGPGAQQHADCKAALVDLRHQHELLLLN